MCCCLVTKSCLTLWDPIDYSPPGSSVHGILQARTLEWIAISFSRGSSPPRDWTRASCTGRQNLYTTEPPGKLKQSQINSVSSLVNRDGRETLTSQSCHEHQMKGLYRKVDVTGRGGERGFTISKEAFRVWKFSLLHMHNFEKQVILKQISTKWT